MALDKYFVTLGVKGQDAVLSVLDNVQKKGKALNSGSVGKVSLSTKAKSSSIGKTGRATTAQQSAPRTTADETTTARQSAPRTNKELSDFSKSLTDSGKKLKQYSKDTAAGSKQQKEANKTTKSSGDALKKYSDAGKQSISNITQGAASLSPTSFMHSLSSLPGLIPHTGTAGKAVSTGMQAITSAPTVDAAKSTAKEMYGLVQRNNSSNYYGGNMQFAKGAPSDGNGSSAAVTGRYSPQERAEIIASVSGAFGRIKKPLADALSPLLQSGKYDTGALSRVGSGNWKSSGTDKGFFLQKLSDSFGDLPPSIAQKFQAKLLDKYGDSEIQKAAPGQLGAQSRDAAFERQGENQTYKTNAELEKKSGVITKGKTGKAEFASDTFYDSLLALSDATNETAINLLKAGNSVSGIATVAAKASSTVLNGFNKLVDTAKADAMLKYNSMQNKPGRK